MSSHIDATAAESMSHTSPTVAETGTETKTAGKTEGGARESRGKEGDRGERPRVLWGPFGLNGRHEDATERRV